MKKEILLLLTAILCCSCGCRTDAADKSAFPDGVIPFPEIPEGMTEPLERASYVMMNFWEPMDFNNEEYSHNVGFIEQNFANFAQFYPYVDDKVNLGATKRMIEKAMVNQEALQILDSIASRYLSDRKSPYYNETAYINLMEIMLTTETYSVEKELRIKYAIANAKKNRPGQAAANFDFITREGKKTSLYKANNNPYTLLFFYNPDCESCKEMIAKVLQNEDVTDLVKRGTVGVVAVYAEGDRDLWDKTKNEYPSNWIVGFDISGILDKELYVYDAPPSIYLLDRSKHVVLKEPTLEQLQDYAQSH